jgi:DNA-binding PadR family transcriptional regulator
LCDLTLSLTFCKTACAMASAGHRLPRVSDKEAIVLELLLREPDSYGLALVAASRGVLKRGTVYVTLGRMEEKGYVTSRQVDSPTGGLPRRSYRATSLGRQLFEAWEVVRSRLTVRYAR